jgi:hypothetical protein
MSPFACKSLLEGHGGEVPELKVVFYGLPTKDIHSFQRTCLHKLHIINNHERAGGLS